MSARQQDLFDHVVESFAATGGRAIRTGELYEQVRQRAGISPDEWRSRRAIGAKGTLRVSTEHKVRWYQQDLRRLGLIERDGSGRGSWRLTPSGRAKLTPARPGRVLLAYSTDLGAALWADAGDVFSSVDGPISLVLTSLPYMLAKPRAYGNAAEDTQSYIDWVCRLLEPLVASLAPSGSVALNVDDTFMPGLPSQRMIPERLSLALCDRLGLHKMRSIVWFKPSAAPGPVQWASLTRQQLNSSHELVLWLAKDPQSCTADNRRVLQPHSETQLRLIAAGGEARATCYGDGAHRLRAGSYANPTAGAIPRDVLVVGQRCEDTLRLADLARRLGLPSHGAVFPTRLAQFLIEFLTEPGELVVDPCAGMNKVGLAAQRTGRAWMSTERMGEYAFLSSHLFARCPGFARALHGPQLRAA